MKTSPELVESAALALHLYLATRTDGELLAEARARRTDYASRNPRQVARLDAADEDFATLFEELLSPCPE